ncbi:MAG: CBS domain-containing protein [Mongoliibacter sp.]|uniref:CBS domain-containing protein n=1 Tax=Mongoliibacter sp. TaxID=2022438 RepID=UPI0012EF4C1E|nr:CBS domain-containing protein [Mongoliibacter sp.]TVP47350.1 MAG: CBS domain-containing protein [Mongoliibacter sp.]
MKLDRKVEEIMTKEVVSVENHQTLAEILILFRKNKIRHIPVLGDKKVVGIISRSDINRLTFGAIFDNQDSSEESILEMLSITQVMSANPKVVSTKDSLQKVAQIFAEEEFHALPVVEDGKLKGIITTTDLIKQMLIDSKL